MNIFTFTSTKTINKVAIAWALAGAWTVTPFAQAQEPVLTYDPNLIIEEEAATCAECHENAVSAWEQTHHKITYDELHLRDEAQAILERLGERGSIRRNDECTQCHYTLHSEPDSSRSKAVMGIGCQRCHGAARNWIEIHHKTKETPNRMERLAKAQEAGMRPTYNLYALASSCFQCHTVPREKLVNMGEHPASSMEFELAAWANGEVRHNFLEVPGPDGNRANTKETDTNRVPSAETMRELYVMGKLLDLEYSLRGAALATEDGPFLEAMQQRIASAYEALNSLSLGVSEVDTVLGAVPTDGGAPMIEANKADVYESAADEIREAAKAFGDKREEYASALESVDSALPSEFRGSPYSP